MRYDRAGSTGFLHNACVDLFSEVSGRQPSGRLFFARTSCLDTRETRLASPSSSTLPLFIAKIVYPRRIDTRIVSKKER